MWLEHPPFWFLFYWLLHKRPDIFPIIVGLHNEPLCSIYLWVFQGCAGKSFAVSILHCTTFKCVFFLCLILVFSKKSVYTHAHVKIEHALLCGVQIYGFCLWQWDRSKNFLKSSWLGGNGYWEFRNSIELSNYFLIIIF